MMSVPNLSKKIPVTYDIYISNLPPDADQKKISKVFSKFGEIHTIIANNAADGSKFGLVRYYCEEDASKAIEDSNGSIFEGGNKIIVKKAFKRVGVASKKADNFETKPEKEDTKSAIVKQRSPDIVPSFEVNHGLTKRETEKIFVSHVENPIVVWGQKQETSNDLNNILDQLQIYCPEAPKLTGKPELEKIYGGQFSEDKCWYRCIVKYIYSADKVKVQYIDFGNTEDLDPSTLVELSKGLTAIPAYAMKYVLHQLWCNNLQDPTAVKYLRDILDNKEADVLTTARLSDHTGFFAEFYINGVCINEKLIESGYAFKKPGLDQRGLKSRIPGSGDASSNNSLKSMLSNNRDSLRKSEPEKDEVTTLKWKLKQLQTEYTSLSNKAQENDLSAQIKNLQSLSSLVRKLRNQIPLDRETPLEKTLAVVQSPNKINIHFAKSVPDVCQSIDAYKNVQDEIHKSKDKTCLNEKLVAREQIKKELIVRLSAAIEKFTHVPLQERQQQVQDAISLLTKYYDASLKLSFHMPQKIETLLATYEDWKEKKKVDITSSRLASNKLEESVSAAFEKLKISVSLNLEANDEVSTEDFEVLLKNYFHALQRELVLTDSDNPQDTKLIGSIVQFLFSELQEESSYLNELFKVLQEFTVLKDQITPWVNKSPSTDELQSVRGKLKKLKSQLRHKLADKIDAEENHDINELEEVAKDLEDIRTDIHKMLKEEDRLMAELSDLAGAHFPELIDSEIDAYITYNKLLKLSHAPDQYTMTNLGSNLSGIYESQFDGEPVIIKEYFLGSASKLSKEEFLSQMASYSKASSPHLEPIQAMFFDKDCRNAYVEVKKGGDILSSLVDSTPLSKQQCQSVIKSLCKALHALHFSGTIHGQVQPEYIIVDDKGNSSLLPPDFSMSYYDRCRSKYVTSSGLEIVAPEMKPSKMSSEPTYSVDIFNLGLLALWIHHPNVTFTETTDGNVDFSNVPMDNNLRFFLIKLLHPNPLQRPTAESCLRSEYLQQPVTPNVQSHLEHMLKTNLNASGLISNLNLGGSDSYVYAEMGHGQQMIANTRFPPPQMVLDNVGSPQQQPTINSFIPSVPLRTQHPTDHQMILLQQQMRQQYHMLHQQRLSAQPLNQPAEATLTSYEPASYHEAQSNDSRFEIGTFDPNAIEVVTSPQSSATNRSNVELSASFHTEDDSEVTGEQEMPHDADDEGEWVDEDGET